MATSTFNIHSLMSTTNKFRLFIYIKKDLFNVKKENKLRASQERKKYFWFQQTQYALVSAS